MNPTHVWTVITLEDPTLPAPTLGDYYETVIKNIACTIDNAGSGPAIHLVYFIEILNKKPKLPPPPPEFDDKIKNKVINEEEV